MDSFCEHLLKRKKKTSEKVITICLILLGIAFTVFSFMVLLPLIYYTIPPLNSFLLPVVALVWWGLLILIKNFNIEYEYAITGSEIDVDKIINKKKRKKMVSTSIRRFDIAAPVLSDKYTDEYKALLTVDCTANSGMENTYFAVYSKDGQKKCLLFDPTDKMLDMIKRYCPDKFFS